ncbi:MAG: class IV adenylate cyclase [Candidatus Buchananbacteria bacterium]
MNLEVEIKARCLDPKAVKTRLKKLSAKYVSQVHQVDTYYQISDKYFLNGQPKLRIREEKNKQQIFLEYHVPIDDFKAKEYETVLGDAKIGQFILEKLGCPRGLVVDKIREKYRLGKINIDLDLVKGLGSFIEIEIMNSKSDKTLKTIYNLLEKLGVSKNEDVSGQSYLNLLWQKKNK